MDKEKIITIIIGLVVGIVIAGGYFAAIKFLPKFSQNNQKVTFTPPQTPTASPSATLTVSQPENQISVNQSPTTVSGKTTPGTRIIIFANVDEKIASADASGNFSADIKLEDGENEISINSLNETIKRIITLEIKP